jgi:hypothetical protein
MFELWNNWYETLGLAEALATVIVLSSWVLALLR